MLATSGDVTLFTFLTSKIMAANLFINGLYNRHEIFDGSFEVEKHGYFCDSYNSFGLFAFLRKNLQDDSWSWRLLNKCEEWFNDNNDMTVIGAQGFLKKVQGAQRALQSKTLSKEADEYIDWLGVLERFLKVAIERKSTIAWWV